MDLGGSATDEILETIDAPIVILNREGDIVRFNKTCEKLTGFAPAEAIGRKVWDFLVPDNEVDAVRGVFEKTRGEGLPTRYINSWKTKSGERRLIEWSNSMLRNTHGEAAYVLAAGVDITEARAREAALHDSRAFLRSIIDVSPVAVVTIDARGAILNFSRQAEETFGYAEEEVLGKNVAILMPEPDHSKHDAYMQRYFETGERRILGMPRVVIARRRNDEEFPAILHITEVRNEPAIYVGFIEDIAEKRATERRLAEAKLELQHAARVGELGEMATSIAHELNQPLTAAASLAGAVSLTLAGAACREAHQEAIALLEEAISEIRRASGIIRHIREFVKKGRTEKRSQEVNEVVEEACALALIGVDSDGIEVAAKYDREVGCALVDRIQIQQVVTNLIRNAVDAMQDSSDRQLTISTNKADGMVEIRIEDTGAGIPQEVRGRLFEPFVTTKPNGTGLGLSISKSIADAHQGEILVTDNNPTGSVFVLRMPAGACDEQSDIG